MPTTKQRNPFGLTERESLSLLAVFHAAQASGPLPEWVLATDNSGSLKRLFRLALLVRGPRLTWSGLAVAVGLSKARGHARSLAA